ncbi:MAG: J domain-containing protein [Paludibacteraceae bacterium]|nr:J domain-containing protein [Paludibacteraceae bacterium]
MDASIDIITLFTILGGIGLLGFVGFAILSRLEFQDEATDKWSLMGLVAGSVLLKCIGKNCKITPYMMEQIHTFALKMTPDGSLPIGYSNFPKGIHSFFKKQADLDSVFEKLSKVASFSERRSFVRLLFRLVAEDDGLSPERWDVVVAYMYKMRLNKANYDYLLKCYAPLRKKVDDPDFGDSGNTASSQNNASSGSSSQGAAATSASSLLKPYFDVFGLPISASKSEVQTTFRRLALQHHPDLPKNAGRQAECEEMMAKINDAYAHIMAGY